MIPIEPDATVKVFRRKIAGHWCTEKETLCLIYGGRILEDEKMISDYELKHGNTIRLVIKQVNKNQAEVAADLLTTPRGLMHAPQKSDITATPFGLGTMGGLAGTASVGMGSVNFMEMQQRMQHELLSNPESLRIIMENPLVCGLMKRPEEMHELMMANPAMKELIEANPEITQMMHNKELMATIANLAHNPAMLQELVRHEDRIALSSSEAIGPSLGVRLPEEDDDIIFMGSAEEVGGRGGGGGGAGLRGLAQFMRGSWGQGRGRRPPPPVSHVFNTAPIRSLLLQMTESPQIMQNMFSAPYIQSMMTSLSQSPELAEFVASQNPAFKDDEKLMDKIPDLIPHLTAQMQSSAVQGLMTNPKALQALMQVQRGFAALQSEAPDLIDNMGIPFDPKDKKTELAEEVEEEKAEEATEAKEGEGEEGSPKKDHSKIKRDPKEEMPLFLNQVTNLIAAAVPGSNTNALPPAEKYAAQAKQLEFLGFTNSKAVLEALDFAGGDINAAIQRLVPKTKPAFDL